MDILPPSLLSRYAWELQVWIRAERALAQRRSRLAKSVLFNVDTVNPSRHVHPTAFPHRPLPRTCDLRLRG